MEKLIFLPIDIDADILNFSETQEWSSFDAHFFQPVYWSSSTINEDNPVLSNILKKLPFSRIQRILNKFQVSPVDSHIDVLPQMDLSTQDYKSIKDNEPCGYRILLKGRPDVLQFWTGETWETAKIPSVPCVYVNNSTTAFHRILDDPGRQVLYIRAYVDPIEHKQLIERSLEKYGHHAIYSTSSKGPIPKV
jgi:hypothetical protein